MMEVKEWVTGGLSPVNVACGFVHLTAGSQTLTLFPVFTVLIHSSEKPAVWEMHS